MDGELKARLDNWFENGSGSTLDRRADELQRLGEELRQIHESMQRIRGRLSEKPSLKSSADPLLEELAQQREKLTQGLAERWIEFLQHGGRFAWSAAQTEGRSVEGGQEPAEHGFRRRNTPLPRDSTKLEPTEQRVLLRDLMLGVGEPRDLTLDAGLLQEVEALEVATQLGEQERWKNLSRDLQRGWLSMMVARTRGLKERIPLPPGMWGRINQVLIRYPVYAKSAAPGHVNGLQAAHKAEGKSWRIDATVCWQALVQELSAPETASNGATKHVRVVADDDTEEADAGGSEQDTAFLALSEGRHGSRSGVAFAVECGVGGSGPGFFPPPRAAWGRIEEGAPRDRVCLRSLLRLPPHVKRSEPFLSSAP